MPVDVGTMTSKERVRAALFRKPIDRCPRNVEATPEAAGNLMGVLGVASIEEVRRALGIDVRHVYPVFRGRVRPPEGRVHFDEWGIGRKFVRFEGGGYQGEYDEIAVSPLACAKSVDEVLAYRWPKPDWWDYGQLACAARETGLDYWTSSGYYSIFERSWYLMGMERFLTDLVTDPEIPLAVLERTLEFYIEQSLRILEAGGGLIDQIDTADDLGTQRGMLISPEIWREHIKPRQERYNRTIKERFQVKIWYHSCGSITPIIEELIEIGVDILDPVQTGAAGMEPAWLKKSFGDGLSFHGGVDTQHTLPYGTPDEVRAEARFLIDTLGRGGGYILAPTHAIQADVPPENVLAMCQLD